MEGVSEYKCPVASATHSGYAAVAYLYAADLVLEQNEGPSASNVSGPLATEQPVHGTSDLIFSATDPGAGVYQALFSVDGTVVQSIADRRKRRALSKRRADNRRTVCLSLRAALSEISHGGRGIRHDCSQQRHHIT